MDSRMLLAACALLASSASALVPLGARMDAARTTCRASRSSLALAGIRMDAAGDPDDEPSAQAPPDEASASAQRRAAEEDQEKWRLPHVDETAYFDDEDVPDDQMMADWRDVRRLKRMFG